MRRGGEVTLALYVQFVLDTVKWPHCPEVVFSKKVDSSQLTDLIMENTMNIIMLNHHFKHNYIFCALECI